ncbi:MAG: nitroreductase family protein [Promethearchaeota archaeon]|jgi:nitroreductase/NAD-dependent dihydropyrimidine dehydrogenase PreA subunit
MTIIGIDYDKCTNCKNCLYSCYYIRNDKEQNKVVLNDPLNLCNMCGHCVGKCPENAFIHEDFGESIEFFDGQDPYSMISYDKLHNFMSAKRSVRQYKSKKIPKELLRKVISSMSYAATGGNARRLKCLVISEVEKIKHLSDSIIDKMLSDPTTSEAYKGGLKLMRDRGRDPVFYKAPHVIILYSDNSFDAMNATIALTTGMLSGQSLGLGSCWIGMAHMFLNIDKKYKKERLSIDGTVWGAIIIGYPAVKFHRIPPRPFIPTRGLEELD